jgi:anti-sigma factor RsiW
MNDRDLTPAESAVLVLDEAENLIWALLDDQLDEASAARLAKLLEEHETVRHRYIDCVQLHIDLQDHFADSARPTAGAKATALPLNMLPGVPGGGPTVPQ